MADTTGMRFKFLTWKIADMNKYLSEKQIDQLDYMDSQICKGRLEDSRSPNHYLVINVDEPYAQEVIDILKKHGHWG